MIWPKGKLNKDTGARRNDQQIALPQSEGLSQARKGEEKLLDSDVQQRRSTGFGEMLLAVCMSRRNYG